MPQPMTTDEVRTSQPLTTADRLGILDLFARYAWAYDGGDAQAYAETFATDGVLADENDLRAVGRPAIAEAIKTFFDMRGLNVWQHHNDHLRIDGDSERCTVQLLGRARASPPTAASASAVWAGYISRLRKVDGEWLFAERTFYMGMPKGLPWKR